MGKPSSELRTALEAVLIALIALGLYLPFLSIQYDTNGIVEAAAIEAGQLVNKNHILYRPIGLLIYRALEGTGYHGNALLVLQTLNAIGGAIGAGLAYALFKSATGSRTSAAIGCFWLATSFVYWMFSTDAAYITLAGMFALGAMVCVAYSRSKVAIVCAGILASLSILTWQAGIFLIPTLLVLVFARGGRVLRHLALLILTIGLISGVTYVLIAYTTSGVTSLAALWRWFTNYSEAGTLPMWGVWTSGRLETAAESAFRSIVPAMLAISPTEITRSVQLGRIAVDVALIAAVVLPILALLKARPKSLWFLLGYSLFVPFIVWWDPFEPKWFLIPNIFLAGFLSCGLQPWLHRKLTATIVVLCVLAIAGANFTTIIRPRHRLAGPDRSIAQCVADQMKPNDIFIAAEWGWPDYLEYLHSRRVLNLISAGGDSNQRMARARESIRSTQRSGGDAYIADPHSHSESHLAWLTAQTGVTLDQLLALGASPAFKCSERAILKVPPAFDRNE